MRKIISHHRMMIRSVMPSNQYDAAGGHVAVAAACCMTMRSLSSLSSSSSSSILANERRFGFSIGGSGWAVPYSLGFVSVIKQRFALNINQHNQHHNHQQNHNDDNHHPAPKQQQQQPSIIATPSNGVVPSLSSSISSNGIVGQLDLVGGASGGALAAALLTQPSINTDLMIFVKEYAKALSHYTTNDTSSSSSSSLSWSSSLLGGSSRVKPAMRRVLHQLLHQWLPADAHQFANNRLFISVTQVWPRVGNVIISQFSNNEQLVDALVASCYLPGYLDKQPAYYYGHTLQQQQQQQQQHHDDHHHHEQQVSYHTTNNDGNNTRSTRNNGVWLIDGGFTCNTPLINDRTYIISPFPPIGGISPAVDVCPYLSSLYRFPYRIDQLLAAAFIPNDHIMNQLWQFGVRDAHLFADTLPSLPLHVSGTITSMEQCRQIWRMRRHHYQRS